LRFCNEINKKEGYKKKEVFHQFSRIVKVINDEMSILL
jgi:hypothetical protein